MRYRRGEFSAILDFLENPRYLHSAGEYERGSSAPLEQQLDTGQNKFASKMDTYI